MKNCKNLILGISLLIACQGPLLAQQEIPDKIKDKITAGINALENAKTPAEMDVAIKEFTEAAAIAPEYADVHYFLGKTLSTMQGSAGQAVKEYKKYLEMYPAAPDKDKVTAEIAQLEEVIQTKNRSYLMGLSLVELPDGIYIRQVNPNYPIDATAGRLNTRMTATSTGVRAGDKIIKIGDTDIAGLSMNQVMQIVEKEQGSVSAAATTTRGTQAPSKYLQIRVMRGDREIPVLMYKGEKKTNPRMKYLGEEDFSSVVDAIKTPLLVYFVSDWCAPCEQYLQGNGNFIIKYMDALSYLTVNMDENILTAKEFNVLTAPTVILYKEGKMVDKVEGYDPELLTKKVEKMMK